MDTLIANFLTFSNTDAKYLHPTSRFFQVIAVPSETFRKYCSTKSKVDEMCSVRSRVGTRYKRGFEAAATKISVIKLQ